MLCSSAKAAAETLGLGDFSKEKSRMHQKKFFVAILAMFQKLTFVMFKAVAHIDVGKLIWIVLIDEHMTFRDATD